MIVFRALVLWADDRGSATCHTVVVLRAQFWTNEFRGWGVSLLFLFLKFSNGMTSWVFPVFTMFTPILAWSLDYPSLSGLSFLPATVDGWLIKCFIQIEMFDHSAQIHRRKDSSASIFTPDRFENLRPLQNAALPSVWTCSARCRSPLYWKELLAFTGLYEACGKTPNQLVWATLI